MCHNTIIVSRPSARRLTVVLHSSWSFIQLSLHGRFREWTNCLQHEARAADLCCQVTNTHFYCRAEMPRLDRQSLKAIDICQQRFVWKLQDSGLIFLLDSASGIQHQGFILLSLKVPFFWHLCAYCPLETKHKMNVLWTWVAMGPTGVGGRVWKYTMWKWECYSVCGRVPPRVCCMPELWLKSPSLKSGTSTFRTNLGKFVGLSAENVPDSITLPCLEIPLTSLEVTPSSYWLHIHLPSSPS